MRQLGPDAVKNKINKYLKKNQQDVIFLKKNYKKKKRKNYKEVQKEFRGGKKSVYCMVLFM